MVTGSIPSQGTCLGYGFDSGQGAYERQPIDVPQGTAPACKLLYSQTYWGLSLISCVTLGPLLHLSEPPLPHLEPTVMMPVGLQESGEEELENLGERV